MNKCETIGKQHCFYFMNAYYTNFKTFTLILNQYFIMLTILINIFPYILTDTLLL